MQQVFLCVTRLRTPDLTPDVCHGILPQSSIWPESARTRCAGVLFSHALIRELKVIASGVPYTILRPGRRTEPIRLQLISRERRTTKVLMELHEGRNRQIRRG